MPCSSKRSDGRYTRTVLSFDLPRFLAATEEAAPGAGDLLFAVGRPPQILADGALAAVDVLGLERLSPFQTETVVLHLLALAPQRVGAQLRETGAASFAYSVPGVSRYRASVFSQRGTFAVTLRKIPERVPRLGELGLPDVLAQIPHERAGLAVLNGPAGSGRTTTLAAVVEEINSTRPCHVLSVEDPIEFLHRHGRATVNQREVGIDTPSLAAGLADGLRQGAQVLLVSEVRSCEEARLLIEAAETGHLVLTSLRGFDTASGLLRLLSLFPRDERDEARTRLARTLRWCLTQQLVAHRDGLRPVVEVWRGTRAAAAFLAGAEPDPAMTADFLRDGEHEGQRGFDRELERRVRAGELDLDVAVAHAVAPRQLELRLFDMQEAEG